MINEYFKKLQIPGTIIQVGEANVVLATIKEGDDFDMEAFIKKYENKNLYFIAGVTPDIGNDRCSDFHIIKKNYFVLDFDIKEVERNITAEPLIKKEIELKKPETRKGEMEIAKEITESVPYISDGEMCVISDNILAVINDDKMLGDYYMTVNSGNGLHIHYLEAEPADLSEDRYKQYKAGMKALLRRITGRIYPVDEGCFNAARLFRVPGSFNNKKEKKPATILDAPKKQSHILNDIIADGIKELKALEERKGEMEKRKKAKINLNGNEDIFSAIKQIDVVNLICSLYPVYYKDGPSNNFFHKYGARANSSTGYFKDKDSNYTVWAGSTEIPGDVQGDPASIVKYHFKHNSYKETIDWFCNEYPNIAEFREKEKEEWKEKQNNNQTPKEATEKSSDLFEDLYDIYNTDYGEYEFLINDIVPKVGITCISASAKQGKSWLILNIINSLVKGVPLFNAKRFETKKCNVLLIDEENSRRGLSRRQRKLLDDPVHITSLIQRNVNIYEDDWKKLIIDKVKDKNIEVIIFDSFRRILGGKDENDAAVINEAYINFKEIMNSTGCAIIFTDHIKKQDPKFNNRLSADSIRGSGDKAAICESIIMLATTVKEDELLSYNTTKVAAILREVEPKGIFRYDWYNDKNKKGKIIFDYKGTVQEEQSAKEDAKKFIEDYFNEVNNEFATIKQITNYLKARVNEKAIKQAITEMKKEKVLESDSISALEKAGVVIDISKYPDVKNKATHLIKLANYEYDSGDKNSEIDEIVENDPNLTFV